MKWTLVILRKIIKNINKKIIKYKRHKKLNID